MAKPLVHFIRLPSSEMTEEDFRLLVKIIPADYDGRKAVDFVAAELAGRLTFWRIGGLMTGLLMTRIASDKTGKTLWLEGIGGKGMVENMQEVWKALRRLARHSGCSSVSGLVERTGMKWVVEEMQFPIVAQIFRQGIVDEE